MVSHVNINHEPSGLAVLAFDFVQRSYEDLHEVISANAALLCRPCTLDRNLFDMSTFGDNFGAEPGANQDEDDGDAPTMYGAIGSVAGKPPQVSIIIIIIIIIIIALYCVLKILFETKRKKCLI